MIPECDLAVIDEAHQLEDVATMYFGVAVSTHRIDEFVHDAGQAAGAVAGSNGQLAASIANAATDVQYACRRLFDNARFELRSQESGGDRLTLTEGAIERLADAGFAARSALDRFVAIIRAQSDMPEDVTAMASRAAALVDDLKIVLGANDPAFVHYVEARGRGVSLRAAPIEVSRIIRNFIVGDRAATVLTSATLAVDGGFEYVKARLGLDEADAVRFPSEFDFTKQAVLYLPPEMPDPRDPDFNRAAAWMIGELLDRTRGRAFVLFTSYAAMRDVHARLESRVGWPLLVQGTAPRTALLREFRATPNAVLLATASFWQGVDVAGEALSCVIIDRLPFASPGDPLVSARIRAINDRGGQAFSEYQVPLATLTLLQGLGRLIRTKSDRGVLAILDPRISRMSYGRRFLGSLPPAPITDDLAVIEKFFAEEA